MKLYEVRFNNPEDEPNPIRVVIDSDSVMEAIEAALPEWDEATDMTHVTRVMCKQVGDVKVAGA